MSRRHTGILGDVLGSEPSNPRVILQSPVSATGWWDFSDVVEVLTASHIDQVQPLIRRVADWTDGGGWAAGYVSYEAGPSFDPALTVCPPLAHQMPLAWFALVDQPSQVALGVGEMVEPPAWQPVVSEQQYLTNVEEIRRQIALGNTYQVNFTVPLQASNPADAWSWFVATRGSHPRSCQAFVHVPKLSTAGPWTIVSFSPELFFRLDGERIWSRPMKGTARPGRDWDETHEAAKRLASSVKNRAENVMIVDMVRNDLGRIGDPGSVEVPELFQVERHPTVLQMTSTVTARSSAPLQEIFAALFPCASITGAPKVSTTAIISQLEARPRGVYTGAIGWVGPNRQARFGVAIRTAVLDHRSSTAIYGVGGGIVWDSDPGEEFAECATKAAVVSQQPPRFSLLETLLWEPTRGAVLVERHQRRLHKSAQHFGADLDVDGVLTAIDRFATGQGSTCAFRIRLTAEPDKAVTLESKDLGPIATHWRVSFASLDVDSNDPRLWHKTTSRDPYVRALESCAQAEVDDVLLVNGEGEVTESSIANLLLQIDGNWLTPYRLSGCLNGTLRAALLEAEVIEEALVTPQMVRDAERLFLVNSVRGWVPVVLVDC